MQLSVESRIAIFLYSLFLAVVLCSISLYAADGTEYTIRSGASEVRLSFAASDRQGHAVNTLRPSDVAVADNGAIIRQFRSFRPASESPVDLVILIDTSDSVASQISTELEDVRSFVEGSTWGERDRISILSFGGLQPKLICVRNCDSKAAEVKLNALKANGATPLYDALVQAAAILEQSHDAQSRSAIILFSDGVDTISMHTLADALQASQNLQAAIYTLNTGGRKNFQDEGDALLNHLAQNTGGLSFSSGQNVTGFLSSVLQDLHGGYILTYDLPMESIGQHTVQLLPTRDPKLQFRSREAYDDLDDK